MKKILGLDLGTNSIGWAVVNAEEVNRENETSCLKPIGIDAAGSRIIPMDAAILGDFDKGNSVSQTKERTSFRGIRRLRERCLLRRERLHRVLTLLGFLPEHFAKELNRYGQFTTDSDPKIAWKKNTEGKIEFIFQDSFLEMVEDFRKNQPELVSKKNNGKDNKKVPYDWTIYYLRKKALTQPITKEELAWILLNFNQKRGYYQLRGEDEEEKSNKKVEFHALKVVAVEDSGEKKGNETWYNIHLENGWIYRRTSNVPLDWVGKIKEFIVTTDVNDDGTPKTDKDGNEKRSFRAPKEDDWTLLKKKTETEIDESHKTVGAFIYDSILANPNQKIIGKLIRTIERKFYKDELRQILEKQKEFHAELRDEKLYAACCEELYASNEAYRNSISNRDFTYLFLDDIIFYQRPLKSKKSLIANCPYESRFDKNGEEHSVKCIAKSNPLFQEFRLWQFVQNLRIYQREKTVQDNQLDLFGEPSAQKLQVDVDITAELFTSEEDYVKLFDWLNDRPSIKQDTLLGSYFKFKKEKGKEEYPYRWNYVEDKEYPCNETRAELLSGLKKCGIAASFLTHEQEMALWHLLYSIDDKSEIEKALKKFADKHNLPEAFAEVFAKIKPFKKVYGSYSEKAIKKLLSLMRMGKYWNYENIDTKTKDRIQKIITGEYDEKIRNRVRDLSINLIEESDFQGLPVWLACYIVYDRHSEAKEIQKWEKPEDIDKYLQEFKQHSLRNPIVEQVITETLRTVRDIWKQVGQIDEIHVELGREMKNPADKRKKMTENIQKNENTNLRIKAMLAEFANPEFGIENVRPYSPSQQDILRIYEENALENLSDKDKDFEFVSKISKSAQPTKSDIIRYKAWLEQQYRSPYTGMIIPLAKLFTAAYEIEHVIPQSRYFDDSFSNKVICEAEVNKLKDNLLGFEFIKNHYGEKVQLSGGGVVEILSVDAYEKFVKDHYSHNNVKKKKLLMADIPEDFIARQLNDSRYISKVVKGLLSNIVREKDANGAYEQEATSKNLISCTGGITDRLKLDWGMNDVWNRIVLPRFERLNQLTGKECFTALSKEGHWIPNMPLELQKGFNKKRIDHRHHAMDAIVIACTTCRHVQYLNNENAKSNNYEVQRGLAKVLCSFKDVEYHKKEKNEKGVWVTSEEVVKKTVPDKLLKPWDTFTQDAQNVLENIIVSFKQNLRVINKTKNFYQHFENGKKTFTRQEKGNSWAIRKPMHKETVFGEINLRMKKPVSLKDALKNPKAIVEKDLKKKILELLADGKDVKAIKKYFEDNKDVWSDVNLSKIDVYYFTQDIKNQHGEVKERYFATRKSLDTSFDKKKIETSIADTGIQKILLAHLESKGGNPELAFSPDGIDEMNRNIKELNGGKNHQPIIKVRVYEKADKFAIGTKGNKSKKFVEAAKGTNLFFAIYESIETDNNSGEEVKVRSYATVPLNMVIDCQKEAGKNWKEKIDSLLKEKEMVANDARLLFMLSPNDLVYLPTEEQIKNGIDAIDRTRIYKMVSCTGNRLYAIPYAVANTIVDKVEFSQLNKIEFSDEKVSIKTTCIPLKVDRLGNIVAVNGIKL
ncbi:MAG: HNH endonuclease domain-containing protein [Paludibacteraceae bacterium]|nr:HNH endonuclease domain-containing protein [Paludibacteraceae bacterium]